MSYANKRGHAKAFDSGIAGAEFITSTYLTSSLAQKLSTPLVRKVKDHVVYFRIKYVFMM